MTERKLVEGAHFTPQVENLIRGQTSGTPAGDIDYTLRAFPNHHRALLSMMNAGLKAKTDKPRGSRYTVQCWFERAIVFRPDDGRVYMLFGIYLLRTGSHETAVRALTRAQELSEEDANLEYNLGLAYFSMKDYDKALHHAQEAYRLGFPLPGLRDMLKRAGKWQDQPTRAPAPTSSESSPSASPGSTASTESSLGTATTK
ncbi:MAG: tetratricopeptide repeat protein [Betaproteobacteria bacterium]